MSPRPLLNSLSNERGEKIERGAFAPLKLSSVASRRLLKLYVGHY